MPRNWRVWLVLSLVWLLSPVARGQDAPKPPEPTPEQIAAAEGKQPLREQTIYIPYAKLRSLFEKEGRGVFVPYEQFQQLMESGPRRRQENRRLQAADRRP